MPHWEVKPHPYNPSIGAAVVGTHRDEEVIVSVETPTGSDEPHMEFDIEIGDGGHFSNCRHSAIRMTIRMTTIVEFMRKHGYVITKES